MIQFTKSIQLIENEIFNPQIASFTLLNDILLDEDNIQYIKLQFVLLQNHQSGNKTTRTGIINIPKEIFDSLGITYDGNITNIQACINLLKNFNICDISNAIIITLNNNGGVGNQIKIVSIKNTTLTLPANIFIKDGYTFSGWAISSNGPIVYTDVETITITDQSIDLYAIWS